MDVIVGMNRSNRMLLWLVSPVVRCDKRNDFLNVFSQRRASHTNEIGTYGSLAEADIFEISLQHHRYPSCPTTTLSPLCNNTAVSRCDNETRV
jgi:hypothetical protein